MDAESLILVPGAGIEPARTLADPRDFKSRVSTKFHHPGIDKQGGRQKAEGLLRPGC